jgi:hypothetical protein
MNPVHKNSKIMLESSKKLFLNTNSHESKAECSQKRYLCEFDKNSCRFVQKMFFQKSLLSLFLAIGFFATLFLFIPDAQAAQIKTIQQGNVYFDYDDITQVVGISTVDQGKSIILLYVNRDSGGTDISGYTQFTATFESDNTVVISRDAAGTTAGCGATVCFYVVEFTEGVSVQRGVTAFQTGAVTNPKYTTKNITLNTQLTDYSNAIAIPMARAP